MPSPIGHTLLGFSVTGFQNKSSLSMAGWYLLILIAGVAPDFDFLPGILIGDPNHFHHGPTHSILAGVVFTVFMYLIIKPLNLKAAVLIFLVYLTHVLADSSQRRFRRALRGSIILAVQPGLPNITDPGIQ